MLLPALFALAAGVADASPPLPPEVAAFTDEAAGWLLAGERLPPDYRVRLLRMRPADRLQVIVFLRRAGLLSDAAWSLADILKPAPAVPEAGQ